jgi:hypothetical protein
MRPPTDPASGFAGPIRSRDIGEGGRVYIALCSACHRGRVNPMGYRWSPAQMRHQIRRGNEIMPPLPPELISDEQVEALLAYLAVSGALEGELPPPVQRVTRAERDDDDFEDDDFEDDDFEDDELEDDDIEDDSASEDTAPAGVAPDPYTEPAQGLDDPQPSTDPTGSTRTPDG